LCDLLVLIAFELWFAVNGSKEKQGKKKAEERDNTTYRYIMGASQDNLLLVLQGDRHRFVDLNAGLSEELVLISGGAGQLLLELGQGWCNKRKQRLISMKI
jgi:hypothetical protein